MKVNLVSVTQSANLHSLTPEQLIVYIARVSNPSNQTNIQSADRLIHYLIQNKHWSPFEMVDMTVEIVTSRAIAQQILRHRSFCFQEFSQRYAKVDSDAHEPIEWRKTGTTNRQSSSDIVDISQEPFATFHQRMETLQQDMSKLYDDLVQAGVAKETARFGLPLCTQTRLYMKGSVRSWIHYLQVRLDDHTQKEHQQIAQAIVSIFKQHFPFISSILFLP